MTTWINSQESPLGFEVGDSAKLESPLEKGAKISLKNQDLFTDEILSHVANGLYIEEIGLSVPKSLTFTLNDHLQFKSIKWADDTKLSQDSLDQEEASDKFIVDFTLMSGELNKAITQLFDVMIVKAIWDGDNVS